MRESRKDDDPSQARPNPSLRRVRLAKWRSHRCMGRRSQTSILLSERVSTRSRCIFTQHSRHHSSSYPKFFRSIGMQSTVERAHDQDTRRLRMFDELPIKRRKAVIAKRWKPVSPIADEICHSFPREPSVTARANPQTH